MRKILWFNVPGALSTCTGVQNINYLWTVAVLGILQNEELLQILPRPVSVHYMHEPDLHSSS